MFKPVGEFFCESKVGDLEMTFSVEQQIFRLQISVYNVFGVQVLEGADDFGRVKRGRFRGEAARVAQVRKKLAPAHVLQQHVEGCLVMMAPLPLKISDHSK